MNSYISIFGLLFVVVAATGYAQNITKYVEPDADVVARASDIVEGEVVSVMSDIFTSTNCFTDLYTMRVTRTLKGDFKIGDMVTVGVNIYTLDIVAGDRHLVLLQSLDSGFLGSCDLEAYSDQFEVSNFRATFGHMVSLFRLNSDGCSFTASSCADERPIIFEEYFSKNEIPVQVINDRSCHSKSRVLSGPAEMLRSKIHTEIHTATPRPTEIHTNPHRHTPSNKMNEGCGARSRLRP